MRRKPQSIRLFLERRDDEVYMLVQVHAELLGAPDYVFPVHRGGEGLLLHLLADALGLEALKTLGSHQSAGRYEARELVNGVQGLRERRFAGHVEVVGM